MVLLKFATVKMRIVLFQLGWLAVISICMLIHPSSQLYIQNVKMYKLIKNTLY